MNEPEEVCRAKGHRLTDYGFYFKALWCETCEMTVRDDWKALMGLLGPDSPPDAGTTTDTYEPIERA